MKRVFSRLPIRIKIIGSSMFGLALISVFLITLSHYGGKAQITAALERKDQGTAEMVALGVAIGMNTGQFEAVQEALEWAKSDSDLVYIVVFDEFLEVLAEYNPNSLDLDPKIVFDPKATQTFQHHSVNRSMAPVEFGDENYGVLFYGTSLKAVEETTAEYTSFALKVCLVIFCLGILVSLFLSEKITRPLLQLTAATADVSDGKWDINLPIESDDEVGRLTVAFKSMVANVDASMTKLQEVNDQLQASIKRMPLAYILTDVDLKILIWNRSAKKIFGHPEEAVLGQLLPDLVTTSESKSVLIKSFNRLIGGDTVPGMIELQYVRANGRLIVCNWHKTLLKDPHGSIVGILSMVEDITKRLESERALTDSLKTSDDLVKAMPSGLFIYKYIDPDQLIFVNGNKAADRMTNFRLDEYKGKEYDDIWTDADPQLKEQLIQVMKSGETLEREEVNYEEEQIVAAYRMRAFRMPNDRLGLAFEDITERIVARDQKRELQEKLERAKRLESLGVLAGGVAHDLNNILGPLVGYPELLMEKLPPDSTERKHVKRIYDSALQAADIVQDLLALARRGRYEMRPTSINQVIVAFMETATISKLKQSQPDIAVNLDLDGNLPSVMGSAAHLSKTFMNIIVNAFEAVVGAGSISIRTLCETRDREFGQREKIPAGDYVVLSIQDTGSGIPESDLGKIFEPYFSRKPMGRSGSGLGLAVVYGVVKDHHGYIDIKTNPGEGTDFSVYFPVCAVEEHRAPETVGDIRGNERILIVDDTPEQRQMATTLLKSLGYQVATACNGREALTYLRNNRADLALLDMIMEPDFDGLDTYEEMIQIQPDVRVVIVSGFACTDRVERMQAHGAGSYVKKPYTRQSIGHAIRGELDRKTTPEPASV